MLSRVHHATAAKAASLGFVFDELKEGDTQYTLRWFEQNQAIVGVEAPAMVEEMRLLKMLRIEYPGLSIKQFGLSGWGITFKRGRKAIAGDGTTLQAAWDMINDQLKPGEATNDPAPKQTKPVQGVRSTTGMTETGQFKPTGASTPAASGSVVKKAYRDVYKAHGGSNGDDLATKMKEHVSDVIDGVATLNTEKLRTFAEANQVWDAKYASLNPGQQRMNVGNRLRAMVRKGYEIVWK